MPYEGRFLPKEDKNGSQRAVELGPGRYDIISGLEMCSSAEDLIQRGKLEILARE